MDRAATTRLEPTVLRCTDVDDAHRHGTSVYHPHRLDLLDETRPFDMRLRAVTVGPVTVGVLSYASPVAIETGDMETSYEVNIPLVGEMDCVSGAHRVLASPDRAVVFPPYGTTRMSSFDRHEPLLGVKLDRSALEGRLAELTGRSPRGAIQTAPAIDLTSGRGREWWSVVRSVVDLFEGLDDGTGLLGNELVMRPLTQSMLTGLLFAVEHPLLQELLEPSDASTPASVRRATDFINSHAADALSVGDIASATGMSTRGLQVSFQHHLQQTPMEYLREVRTRRAHADLVEADPGRTTVAEVAHRWGFAHVGRFAARYRARYGVSPSATLTSRS